MLETARQALRSSRARRAFLFLRSVGRDCLELRAVALALDTEIDARLAGPGPTPESDELPQTAIEHVRNTLSPLMLADARHDERFRDDPAIQRREIRALLCYPLINHGDLLGVLYLDHDSADAEFTARDAERVTELTANVIASLDNKNQQYGN